MSLEIAFIISWVVNVFAVLLLAVGAVVGKIPQNGYTHWLMGLLFATAIMGSVTLGGG